MMSLTATISADNSYFYEKLKGVLCRYKGQPEGKVFISEKSILNHEKKSSCIIISCRHLQLL